MIGHLVVCEGGDALSRDEDELVVYATRVTEGIRRDTDLHF